MRDKSSISGRIPLLLLKPATFHRTPDFPRRAPPGDLQERAPEAGLAFHPIFGGRRRPDEAELQLPAGEGGEASPVVRESLEPWPAQLRRQSGLCSDGRL